MSVGTEVKTVIYTKKNKLQQLVVQKWIIRQNLLHFTVRPTPNIVSIRSKSKKKLTTVWFKTLKLAVTLIQKDFSTHFEKKNIFPLSVFGSYGCKTEMFVKLYNNLFFDDLEYVPDTSC